jgi:aminopeptidase N
MSDAVPKTIYLKDYTPPAYLIEQIDLHIDLTEDITTVTSKLKLAKNAMSDDHSGRIVLDGVDLILKSVKLDNRQLGPADYTVTKDCLKINGLPDNCRLEIQTEIKPQENTSLEGLYKSSGNFCTQCEPEGFRKITYALDRPDVMSRYSTTLVADKEKYPVLLSNGNLVASGELEGGRHWVKFEDPHKKPTYLFALVAGDLVRAEKTFTTRSGREVGIRVFVQRQNAEKCEHALRSIVKAMKWDEDRFGREYDLDVFMVVAVDDFNAGAMENKGLNIFNSKYVLAKPETATDDDFESIEAVIGHEYFHNWSGNRVTCRDWFQLSLKEGFTVFRDQQFTAEMTSLAVKRIKDVNVLRTYQFREDAGPLVHPVRPASYVEINNFYTLTVYNKGAEVVRMVYNLLGEPTFRKGCDLYFDRYDGQAVTTDDFIQAMQEASRVDLSQFKLWYSQAGTPELKIDEKYDERNKSYSLTIAQTCPVTADQSQEKMPFHIPFAMGLMDREGNDLQLKQAGETETSPTKTRVLELRRKAETFNFVDVPSRPVLSALRGFSAPVRLLIEHSDEDLAFLMANDSDEFNRWDAAQRLATRIIERVVNASRRSEMMEVAPGLIAAIRKTLIDDRLDKRLIVQAISLPSETYLAEQADIIDPQIIHEARLFVLRTIAAELKDDFLSLYHANIDEGPYTIDGKSIGERKLKNACLGYLMGLDDEQSRKICLSQFKQANNMTDEIAALVCLANSESQQRTSALDEFYNKWQTEPLVIDKWFAIQATSRLENTFENVARLREHPDFNIKNPNRVRSLVGAFSQANLANFHDPSGRGYQFLTENVIEIDRFNPQVAARLLTPLSQWRKFEPERRSLMKSQLERIRANAKVSKNVLEIVSKSLIDS